MQERERGEISGVRFPNRQEEMRSTHWWKDGPQEDSYLAVTGGKEESMGSKLVGGDLW